MTDKSIKGLLIFLYLLVVIRIVIFVLDSLLMSSMGMAIPSRPTLSDVLYPLTDSVYSLLIGGLSVYVLYKVIKAKFSSKIIKTIIFVVSVFPLVFSILFGIEAFYVTRHQFIEYQNRDTWALSPYWKDSLPITP